MTPIKKHIIYTFLCAFVATLVVGLVGAAREWKEGILTILFGTAAAQCVTAITVIARAKHFFEDSEVVPKIQKEHGQAIAQLEAKHGQAIAQLEAKHGQAIAQLDKTYSKKLKTAEDDAILEFDRAEEAEKSFGRYRRGEMSEEEKKRYLIPDLFAHRSKPPV
jgi:hypothetical protein